MYGILDTGRRIIALVLAACLLPLAASGPAAAAEEEAAPTHAARPNVLLVTIDALRADHVGCYEYGIETSPTVDRLAHEGVRFADATVQWPKTWPSMASMLTGTYPATNGIRHSPRRPLPAESITLAEILRDSGYRTAAVVANVNVGKKFAFDQGFEHFVESWVDEVIRQTGKADFKNRPGLVKRYTNATTVVDKAIDWLETLDKNDEFFLWLHYMEPHGPYVPPAEYAELFAGRYQSEPTPPQRIPQYQKQADPRTGQIIADLGFYKAQYDREIRYFDDELDRLLKFLEARGLRDNTLTIITADHGESLGEHDYYLEHGKLPYQPCAHVPLIMIFRDRLPAGRVIRSPVGLIDLVPTILDLLGVPAPPTLEGISLRPMIEAGEHAGPRYVFMESGYGEPSELSVRSGPWKLVHHRDPRKRYGASEYELFNLQTDPREQHNVADQFPNVAEELKTALANWMDSTSTKAKERTDEINLHDLDESTQELLKSLGYVE